MSILNQIKYLPISSQRVDSQYIPDRYLGYEKSAAEYAAGADVSKRDHFSFGGGRRIWFSLPNTFPYSETNFPLVQVSTSRNRVCLSRLCDFYGALIWNVREMRTGNLFLWILPPRGWCPEVFRRRNPFHVVFSLFVSDGLMVVITPRSEKHERIMRKEWEIARGEGVDFSNVQFARKN
jgi:hypothetical protein